MVTVGWGEEEEGIECGRGREGGGGGIGGKSLVEGKEGSVSSRRGVFFFFHEGGPLTFFSPRGKKAEFPLQSGNIKEKRKERKGKEKKIETDREKKILFFSSFFFLFFSLFFLFSFFSSLSLSDVCWLVWTRPLFFSRTSSSPPCLILLRV